MVIMVIMALAFSGCSVGSDPLQTPDPVPSVPSAPGEQSADAETEPVTPAPSSAHATVSVQVTVGGACAVEIPAELMDGAGGFDPVSVPPEQNQNYGAVAVTNGSDTSYNADDIWQVMIGTGGLRPHGGEGGGRIWRRQPRAEDRRDVRLDRRDRRIQRQR
jgi:hypothetical protein